MIIDTSALLAIYFKEQHGDWARDLLGKHAGQLKMSYLNLAEVLIKLKDRQPQDFDSLQKSVFELPIEYVPPTLEQTVLAAKVRHDYKINLGDCFAYALAKSLNEPIIALDSDFKKTDLTIIFPE